MRRFIALMGLLLLCLSSAQAATYYVKPGGSNSNSGLSEALAWQTVTKACQTLVAGDTVFIRAGIYNETSYRNGDCWGVGTFQAGMAPLNHGTSTDWIVYKGYPGDTKPIIRGLSPSENIGSGHRMGIDFKDGDCYLVYDSLEFRGGPTGLHFRGSGADLHDIIVRNCEINSILGVSLDDNFGGILMYVDSYEREGPNAGDGTPAVRNITVENCHIHHIGRWSGTTPNYSTATNTGGFHMYGCDSCLIRNNVVHEADGGIAFKHTGRFSEVYGNVIYNCGVAMQDRWTGSCPDYGYDGSRLVGTNWHHNIAYHNQSGFVISVGGNPSCVQTDSASYFWNNTIDCDSGTSAVIALHDHRGGVISGTGYASGFFMFNNIIVDAVSLNSSGQWVGLVNDGQDSRGNFSWSNSLTTPSFVYEDYNMYDGRGATGQYFNWHGSFHNLTGWKSANITQVYGGAGRGTSGMGGENSRVGDPLFVDEGGRDYRLQPTSPAISGGKGGTFTFYPGSAREKTMTIPTYLGALGPDPLPTKYANPLNAWIDSTDSRQSRSMYLCGMDAGAPPDGDTLAIKAGWKILIGWAAAADNAAALKTYDPTARIVLYSSLDHGLRSIASPIDTIDPGNEWNGTLDEYSHYRSTAADSGKNYYSLFYTFDQDTKILLSPYTSGGLIYYDTVFFRGVTLPISDDDSSSVVPDIYSSPYFTNYGTLNLVTSNQVGGSVYRRLDYVGTPVGAKTTRVNPDFSSSVTRWADQKYQMRAMAQNLKNLGGTNNDVYGWGALQDAGFHWDGVYLDNSADTQIEPPEASTLISGGNIRASVGVIGNWYADSTKNKMRSYQKLYFAQLTSYFNNTANWWDNQPRATAANFGTWTSNTSGGNPITRWFNDSNYINVKVLEFAANDKAYSIDAYETVGNGRSTTELKQLDSLARANDFYVMFSSRNDGVDTTLASGWGGIWQGFLRSNWARYRTFLRHRGIFAMQPMFFLSSNYLPCSGSSGTAYQGLNYSPYCNDRAEVDSFFNLTTLPYMKIYNMGYAAFDSSAIAMSKTDASGAAVTIFRTFFRKINGVDTTDSYIYYFPRKLSSWEWRRSGNHKVTITPPTVRYKRLEYNGTLTAIDGAVQDCWIGDQLILSYTHSVVNAPSLTSPPNGSLNQATTVTLDWGDVGNALTYQYQVDDNSDFSSVFYSATVTPSTGSVSGLANATVYNWRVRSCNATDTSAWTAGWTFTTQGAAGFHLCYVVNSDTVFANLTVDSSFISFYKFKRNYTVHVITDDSAHLITNVDAYDGYFISETVTGTTLTNLKPTSKGVLIADRGSYAYFDVATAQVGPYLLTSLWTLNKVDVASWITSQMSPQIFFDFDQNYGCFPFTGLPASATVLFAPSSHVNWNGTDGTPDTSFCYTVDAGGSLATSGAAAGRRAVALCFYPFLSSNTAHLANQGGYCHPSELLGNISGWVFSDQNNHYDGGYNCYSHEQHEVNQGWKEFGQGSAYSTFIGGRFGFDNTTVGIMWFRLWNMNMKILNGWSPDSLVLTMPIAVSSYNVDAPPFYRDSTDVLSIVTANSFTVDTTLFRPDWWRSKIFPQTNSIRATIIRTGGADVPTANDTTVITAISGNTFTHNKSSWPLDAAHDVELLSSDSYTGFDLWVKGYEIIAAAQWHAPMTQTGASGLPNAGGRDSTWVNRLNAINRVVGAVPWAALDMLPGTDHALAAFDSIHITAANFPNDGTSQARFVFPGALLRKAGFNWAAFKTFDVSNGADSTDIELTPNFFNSPRGIYAQRAELYLSPGNYLEQLKKKKKLREQE